MELKTMKTRTGKSSSLHGLKMAALAIGTGLVLAGCAGNRPPSNSPSPSQRSTAPSVPVVPSSRQWK